MRTRPNTELPHSYPVREASLSPGSVAGLLLAGAALLLTAMVALAEPASPLQPAGLRTADLATPGHLVTPGQMQSGGLLLRSNRPGRFVTAPRLATDVRIFVNGPVARAIVTQVFENPSEQWVEGVYVFPLPHDAAVDTLKLRIGDRFIEGQVKPRVEARKIYDKAKRAGRKSSLIEQQRPNVFSNAIANIGPGETVVVQFEYQQTIAVSDDTFSLRFPMVVAPRYDTPPAALSVGLSGTADSTKLPAADRTKMASPVLNPSDNPKTNPVTLRIELKTGFAISKVKSHHHEVSTRPLGNDHLVLTLDQGAVPADRDFELTWQASGRDQPLAALFRQRVGDSDYLLAYVVPPTASKKAESDRMPRDLIFVVDTSGSMAGRSIEQARNSLKLALGRLHSGDRFNIIRYANDISTFSKDAIAANPGNLERARKFVEQLTADGGTKMLPALRAALQDSHSQENDRLRQIVFMTDGAIGNEEVFFKVLAAHRGRSRLFAVGIGSAPNSHFMSRAAEVGRGSFVHIGNHEQIGERMNRLLTRLERPAATHLKAVWSQTGVTDTAPDPLPDLYHGEPIVLTAKAATLEGSLTVTGQRSGRQWQVELPLAEAVEAKGLDRLWARRKITSLEVKRLSQKDRKVIDRRIQKLAMAHHLVSRTTSLVAVDVTPSRPAGAGLAAAKLPLNLPDGWDFDAVFGDRETGPKQRDADLKAGNEPRRIRYASLKGLPGPAKVFTPGATSIAASNVILPATATGADLKVAIGAVLIAFATMLALIGMIWGRIPRPFVIASRPGWENWK